MSGRLSIAKQGLIVVILLLSIELMLVIAIAISLQDSRAKLARERHFVSVISGSSRIAILIHKLGTALALDVMPERLQEMVGDPPNLSELRNKIERQFQEIMPVADGDREALALIAEQRNVLQEVLGIYRQDKEFYKIDILNRPQIPPPKQYRATDLSERYDRLLAHYKTLGRNAPQETSAAIGHVKRMIVWGLTFNVLAALAVAYFFNRRVSRRIIDLADNMHRFQRREALPPPRPAGSDEIDLLELLFREMVSNLNQANKNERALIEGAFDVICTIDGQGNFLEVNSACSHQWSYAPDQVREMNISDLVDPDQIETVERRLDSVKTKNSAVSFETGIKCGDGRSIHTQWSCYWSNRIKACFCFIRDLSELNSMESLLRAREEEVRTLMRNLPIGLLVVDEENIVKSANNKMEGLIQSDRGSLLGTDAETAFAPTAGTERTGSTVLEQARKESPLRCRLNRARDKHLDVEINVSRLVSGNSADTLIIVEDVEERLRLENMKRDFVDILRQSFGAPLTAVRETVATAGGEIARLHEKNIERILSNADRLLRLIDELLDIETLGPGKLVGKLQAVPISSVLESAVDSLRGYAERQCVQITLMPSHGDVMADSDRLVQVVTNLLANAVKFSPKDGEVVVACSHHDGTIEVSIADSGRGVPEEMQEAIFKPYVQASAQDVKKGTGLGLPICKTIIEAHNGTIGVRAHRDGGSVFWFRIPAQTSGSQSIEQAEGAME